MNLFGEITGTQRIPLTDLIETRNSIINSNKNKAASELYASELIKRNGLSDQKQLYKNEIYSLYSENDTDKKSYFTDKNKKLNKTAGILRDAFVVSYKKALQEGYSQSAAERIAQAKTNKKKEVLMEKYNTKYPF